jgi:hypothetical protein
MRMSGRLDRFRRSVAARTGFAAVALIVAAATGCSPDDDEGSGLPQGGPSSQAAPDLSDADLWLSFDEDEVGYDGSTAFPDAAEGSSVGRVVTADGGSVELVPGANGSGSAVAFPARCAAATGCPRAMVEVLYNLALDPAERDFEYGASVWLAPDQTTSGSNIVQQGRFGTEGGQWKLQVDNDEGQPSCVVRGAEPGAEPLVVRSKISISDSAWHRVVCRRDADGLSIEVDGEVAEKDGHTGSVSSEWPIRVGAPGVNEGDDQFHGQVDDVYLRIGPT